MVSIPLNEENKHNLLIGVIMVILAVLFLLYMGSSMVRSTNSLTESVARGMSLLRRLMQ